MISTILSSSSASWLLSEAAVAFCAAIGGLIVLRGLWLEGYREKEEFPTIEAFRTFKTMESRGRKWVFWGVLFEVIIAFALSIKDGVQYHRLEKEIFANDPRQQPVSDILVSVVVKLEGTNFERINDPYDVRINNWVMLLDNKTNAPTLNLGNMGSLMAEDVLPFFRAKFQDRSVDYHGYFMKYFENPVPPFEYEHQQPAPDIRPVAEYVLEKVKFLRISPGFIPNDKKVIGGEAWLTINGTLRRKFIIYPQGMDTNFQEWNPNFKSLVFLATNSIP
jgi:hypothetical protein